MFRSRQSLKDEIVSLKYRIADLEERLCPCEQHDFIEIGKQFVMHSSFGDGDYYRKYKCKRCGKVVRKYDEEE